MIGYTRIDSVTVLTLSCASLSGLCETVRRNVPRNGRVASSRATYVIAHREDELTDPPRRLLVQILLRVIELAAMNHQPVSAELWKRNQQSGYLGPVKPKVDVG